MKPIRTYTSQVQRHCLAVACSLALLPLAGFAQDAKQSTTPVEPVPTETTPVETTSSRPKSEAAMDKSAAATAAAATDAGASTAADTDASGVLRTQILLDRAHFSPGEIDGAYGSNTRHAIAGFQRSRDLEPTGKVDAETLAALDADTVDALVKYRLTAADVAGPFIETPTTMEAKAKLDHLGYESAIEALGEQFHASPALLQRLNPGAKVEAGATWVVPNVAAAALPKGGKVVVDKSDSVVMLVDDAGKTLAQWPATMGSSHDPLPIGEWTIKGVAPKPVFHYNPDLFWDAEASDTKAVIPAGPNNPVGVVWIDLSKEHYGIHGTPVPSTIGKTQSHGCIRMTNWSAHALAQAVAPGTVAVLRQ